LRLKREFGFDLVLQHATEAWRVTDEIARAQVPVSIILLDSPGGKLETSRYRLDYGAILEQAGIEVAIHTDDYVTPSRLFLRSGGLAMRGGMSEASVLRSLTLNPARMLKLEHRIGSLQAGKDADFVILSGAPFSVYTHVLETWIDGEPVFDRSDPAQRVYATGGYRLGREYPSLEERAQ
jgi:imidazolonepropionase-like amidohydrolase